MSYTQTTQQTLQATGSDAGTWGTVANLNFSVSDQALNGYLAKSVAGSSNVTLTWPVGTNVSNEANVRFINFTGVLTGNITVFYPAVPRRMNVQNSTTGAHTLTISIVGTPGATVIVPQGRQMPLWTDGTNIFNALANLGPVSTFGGMTVAGGLIATQGTTVGGGLAVSGGAVADTLISIGNATIGGTLLSANFECLQAGFQGTSPIAKPTVTGTKSGVAALGSLMTALVNYGLVTDSTTP